VFRLWPRCFRDDDWMVIVFKVWLMLVWGFLLMVVFWIVASECQSDGPVGRF
jgi:hypothetical protein